jgi:glutamate synthase domain-containing protein 1
MEKFGVKYLEKDISACALSGILNEDGSLISGEEILRSILVMNERGNGLGAGFAGYGIYPDYKDYYAFHLMYSGVEAKETTEKLLEENFYVESSEKIPTRSLDSIRNPPILWRYFVKPRNSLLEKIDKDEFVVKVVMYINSCIDGAFVMSSGKNMGVFKAVGFPEDVGDFYRIKEYEAYMWLAHSRFPTNTPGWWGGAHPFSLLDWAVIHNGEISSYGTNKRYLEMFGYKCTLMTDTEVMTYLFDLLVRRHKLPIEVASIALAPPFWEQVNYLPKEKRELVKAIRMIYGSALVNGPFAIILGFKGGMVGLNDRIKLRPLVAARKKNTLYIASEEAGIREVCEKPDEVWHPIAGEPIIGRLKVS